MGIMSGNSDFLCESGSKKLGHSKAGMAPGEGYQALAPNWNMLAPHQKVKNHFLENFGITNTLKTIF